MAAASVSYPDFFRAALAISPPNGPYLWQEEVADGRKPFPQIVSVPTGLGKTEGVVLGWAYRRLHLGDQREPRHLIYCLPMRVLVRQTEDRLRACFENLAAAGILAHVPNVYVMLGGDIQHDWVKRPEDAWVLIGTQDQLLSRALNRGYAMNRFEWPMHFGLLNQDCRWIADEVQLMGPGLWTTAQLDWMRLVRFRSIKACRTTWMSATVGAGFLATTDRKRDGRSLRQRWAPRRGLARSIAEDGNPEIRCRRAAERPIDWFHTKKDGTPFHEQLARAVAAEHILGTLSLVVCNTVEMAREVFRALPAKGKVLLTSQFRRQDRYEHEGHLLEFEGRRQAEERRRDHEGRSLDQGKPLPGEPGLICVSTQVVEAGVDVSAHRLWSELAPWSSVIQRLGRLNRDGRDNAAHAWFWEAPEQGAPRKATKIGPYDREDVCRSRTLVDALVPISKGKPIAQAIRQLMEQHKQQVDSALQPKREPMPRALDVHGLFSTERDVHGGFTDVSAFVRGADPDADLTVFWRDWLKGERGGSPPRTEDLDGPPLDLENEGCPVPFFRLRDMLKRPRRRAWLWNDEDDAWESVDEDDLRPGMVVMLHQTTGGYDAKLGWTGDATHRLASVPRAGRGRALRDDDRTETGYWAQLTVHLGDAKSEAETLCTALGFREEDAQLRTAVVEAAALHDLGKAHPLWQAALPAAANLGGGPWAKCPRVLAIDALSDDPALRHVVRRLRADAVSLGAEPRRRGREAVVRLRWAVGQQLTCHELESLRGESGVRWAGHVPFRPGLRHEAASALAMWRRYREGRAQYTALAVYLAAAHHGKVRTVMRSTTDSGDDVFGVPRNPDGLDLSTQRWPFDFSVAKDGAEGIWDDGQFILTGYGWTGLVADLLGPWRAPSDDASDAGVVPAHEPRRLGPFVLAYLEALVRVADWRASEHPSQCKTPAEMVP